MIGERHVRIAAGARGNGHGLEAFGAVRPVGVTVEVAPKIFDLDEPRQRTGQGGFDLAGVFAQLGWDPRQVQGLVDVTLGRSRDHTPVRT